MTAAARARARGGKPTARVYETTPEPVRPSPTKASRAPLIVTLWHALRPEDDREATLYLGLGLLSAGLAFSAAPWLALVVPGAILTLVALAGYVLPRRREEVE